MNLLVTGSLLGTLDALAVAAWLTFLLFITIVLSATGSLGVPLAFSECGEHESLSLHVIISRCSGTWKRGLESCNLGDGDRVRE